VDVPLAFQELASRIAQLVPCDRVGLAQLSVGGNEFQTYTARAEMADRRVKTKPEVTFRTDRTLIGSAVRLREPVIVRDLRDVAPDHLDANVVASAGFKSTLIVPLISTDRAVGTLSVVSRRTDAFTREHADVLMPVAEILAVAYVAEQLQVKMGRLHTVEAMSEQMLAESSEINSALQTIIGHCDLLARHNTVAGSDWTRDLATVTAQSQRIADLLEKMREGARRRLQEASDGVSDPAVPSQHSRARNRA
jgi:transcriptional regulator with GAF, ATPase, and Fis domain